MCGAIGIRRYDYAAGSVAQSSAAQSGNVGERTTPIPTCASHATPTHRALSSLAIAPTAAAAAAAGEAGGRTAKLHLPRAVAHLAIARHAVVLACGRPMRAPTSGGGPAQGGRGRAPSSGAGAHRPSRDHWLRLCRRLSAQTPPRLFVSFCCLGSSLRPRPGLGLPSASSAAAAAWLRRRHLRFSCRALRQRPASPQQPSSRPPRPGLELPPAWRRRRLRAAAPP